MCFTKEQIEAIKQFEAEQEAQMTQQEKKRFVYCDDLL